MEHTQIDIKGESNMKHYYKGKEVIVESELIEYDEDVIKTAHKLIDKETGKLIEYIDWSSYDEMSEEDIKLYLELGCPKRSRFGPLNSEDLQEMKKKEQLKSELIQKSREGDHRLDI